MHDDKVTAVTLSKIADIRYSEDEDESTNTPSVDLILRDGREAMVMDAGRWATRKHSKASLNGCCFSPNPPKDTDGRREGSGRGWVRELQGRWPGVLG